MQVATMLTSGTCSECGASFQSTSASATLCMVCAYDTPPAHEVTIGVCECEECGGEYDFERSGADHTDQCPTCQAAEEAREAAAEVRQDAIDAAEGERDEASDDIKRIEAEMAELREELSEAKRRHKAATRTIAKLSA